MLYWRTTSGVEVDFVIETQKRLLPVEVKASRRVTTADAKGLKIFLDEYGDRVDGGLLLHTGEEVFNIASNIVAAPWWTVC